VFFDDRFVCRELKNVAAIAEGPGLNLQILARPDLWTGHYRENQPAPRSGGSPD
jgi:hypothetical protein